MTFQTLTSRLCRVLLASFVLLAVSAQAEPVQGRDYSLIVPVQPTDNADKVDVIEFFSYGCPHCAAFNPSVTTWAAKLPSNAVFTRVPVSFGRPQWGQLARTYYTLQSMGLVEKLDAALFTAIHQEHQNLFDEDSIVAWVAAHGVDAAKFRAEFNSFSVTTKATRAEQLARNYKVSGVPTLAIDGKYTVMGQNFDEMLRNASAVVEKAAAEHKAHKS
ncbi:MAG TPA: thiol:disulfide interchange protein DsbA/DsbL [Steroidobacteraceae bacterium]|nr:thiol:disulfide interchange protein DsbA/DsbL [Steroidobacteraceae bacterium]